MNRREFLIGAASAGFAGCATGIKKSASCAAESSCVGKGKIIFGACRPLKDAKLLKAHGYDFFENAVAAVLKPDCSEDEWKRQKDLILNCGLPLRSCNGFLPGTFRLTGPKANFAPALDYAEKVLRRAEEVGVKTIVFGSGGARNVPGDILGPRDQRPKPEQGVSQFTEFCRILCNRVSDLKTVVMVIEPLRPNESNIINYVWQGMQIMHDVNSPRLKVLADFFHMLSGRECARSIVEAGSDLRHCHIASKNTRKYPGSGSDDAKQLKPYFDALKQIGYTGGVSCECSWPKERSEFEKALDDALALMKSLA